MGFNFIKDLRLASLVWLLFLAISSVFTCANAENMTEPRRNDNLSVFQQWRSAVECMFNKSIQCTEQQQLSLNLTLEVSEDEAAVYCQNGCLEHTLAVLDCINDVKRDFWFTNSFDTWTLRRFLTEKCSNSTGFSYKDIQSGGIQVSQKMVLSIILPLLASVHINHLQHIIM